MRQDRSWVAVWEGCLEADRKVEQDIVVATFCPKGRKIASAFSFIPFVPAKLTRKGNRGAAYTVPEVRGATPEHVRPEVIDLVFQGIFCQPPSFRAG